ncbi:MAG: SDR family oxidoreductase, partial [Candidatus Latescibacterota bacterium]
MNKVTLGRVQDRVALITGAAKGIGKATAVALATEGAKIVLSDIDGDALDRTLAEFLERGTEAIAVRADVTNSREIAEMVKQSRDRFGRIDILVNNAGGAIPKDSIHLLELTEEQWDWCVQLNLKSVFLVSREVLPLMIQQGKGNIVNISSMAARYGIEKNFANYTAAKAGVLGLTRHMAREFGPQGIRVNVICPGHCLSGDRTAQIWAKRPDKDQMI